MVKSKHHITTPFNVHDITFYDFDTLVTFFVLSLIFSFEMTEQSRAEQNRYLVRCVQGYITATKLIDV